MTLFQSYLVSIFSVVWLFGSCGESMPMIDEMLQEYQASTPILPNQQTSQLLSRRTGELFNVEFHPVPPISSDFHIDFGCTINDVTIQLFEDEPPLNFRGGGAGCHHSNGGGGGSQQNADNGQNNDQYVYAETDDQKVILSMWKYETDDGSEAFAASVNDFEQGRLYTIGKGFLEGSFTYIVNEYFPEDLPPEDELSTEEGRRFLLKREQQQQAQSSSLLRGGSSNPAIATETTTGTMMTNGRQVDFSSEYDGMKKYNDPRNVISRDLQVETDTIDLMLVWSKEAECLESNLSPSCTPNAGTETTMRARLDLAVSDLNMAYQNSNIDAAFNVVHAYRHPTYSDAGKRSVDILFNIFEVDDGELDDIPIERANHCADMVAFIGDGRNSWCGVAWLLEDELFPEYMHSVTSLQCLSSYTLIHEIGHNMGCRHNRANDVRGEGCTRTTTTAFGWQEPTGAFRTVMAYRCGSKCPGDTTTFTGTCNRGLVHSSPSVMWLGQPTGNSENDCARRIRIAAPIAANTLTCSTNVPSSHPSDMPSSVPSDTPSQSPSQEPSNKPSSSPSSEPSLSPSNEPTMRPSLNPSASPTMTPTLNPSASPSDTPTRNPSRGPSGQPTYTPSAGPTTVPTIDESTTPTGLSLESCNGLPQYTCGYVDEGGSIVAGYFSVCLYNDKKSSFESLCVHKDELQNNFEGDRLSVNVYADARGKGEGEEIEGGGSVVAVAEMEIAKCGCCDFDEGNDNGPDFCDYTPIPCPLEQFNCGVDKVKELKPVDAYQVEYCFYDEKKQKLKSKCEHPFTNLDPEKTPFRGCGKDCATTAPTSDTTFPPTSTFLPSTQPTDVPSPEPSTSHQPSDAGCTSGDDNVCGVVKSSVNGVDVFLPAYHSVCVYEQNKDRYMSMCLQDDEYDSPPGVGDLLNGDEIVACGCCSAESSHPEHNDDPPNFCLLDNGPAICPVEDSCGKDGDDKAMVWYCYLDAKKKKEKRKCEDPYESKSIKTEKGDYFTRCGEDCLDFIL